MYFAEARKDLEKAVELDPECAIAYIYLGGIRLRLGDMPGAAEMVKKAYEFSSKAAEKDRLLIASQYALCVKQDEEKRARILQEIASRFPIEKAVYSYLTAHYTSKGMFKEAAAAAEKGPALDPNRLPLLNQLAYAYLALGDTVKAEAAFKNAVAIAPQEPNPLDSLGEYYFQTGRLDEAIEG